VFRYRVGECIQRRLWANYESSFITWKTKTLVGLKTLEYK
jgi:hypothetical protein